ncbi:MAG: type II toxin-antitoxin system VapC family toxin [Bacteroidetes bacterium]|nr:type II toxin-antitoxin system VapC family toxin [Bacteroidota bacterium]
MNRILVDTNVLVYSIDEDSKFNSRAIKLLTNPNYDLYTTSKNLSEFLVVLTKGIEVPLTIKETVDLLEGLMANLTILYPSKNSFRQFKKLVLKYKPRGLKIHDFENVSIGLENGIKHVATINIKDFKSIDELHLIEF